MNTKSPHNLLNDVASIDNSFLLQKELFICISQFLNLENLPQINNSSLSYNR